MKNQELTEHQIMSQIHDYLRYQGILVWRMNTGAAKYDDAHGKTRLVRYGVSGMSDLIGIYKGRFLAVEVKRPSTRKNVTWWQEQFITQVNDAGGIAFVATSIEEVEAELKKYEKVR